MKRYGIEVSYEVTEYVEVEADNLEAAEDKALELVKLGATNHNLVGDETEEAEVTRSEELAPPEGKQ